MTDSPSGVFPPQFPDVFPHIVIEQGGGEEVRVGHNDTVEVVHHLAGGQIRWVTSKVSWEIQFPLIWEIQFPLIWEIQFPDAGNTFLAPHAAARPVCPRQSPSWSSWFSLLYCSYLVLYCSNVLLYCHLVKLVFLPRLCRLELRRAEEGSKSSCSWRGRGAASTVSQKE